MRLTLSWVIDGSFTPVGQLVIPSQHSVKACQHAIRNEQKAGLDAGECLDQQLAVKVPLANFEASCVLFTV